MNARQVKQSMSDLRHRRLLEHNQRLREELTRPRMRVSEASASLIRFCQQTKDPLITQEWGASGGRDNPYAPTSTPGCKCILM